MLGLHSGYKYSVRIWCVNLNNYTYTYTYKYGTWISVDAGSVTR